MWKKLEKPAEEMQSKASWTITRKGFKSVGMTRGIYLTDERAWAQNVYTVKEKNEAKGTTRDRDVFM